MPLVNRKTPPCAIFRQIPSGFFIREVPLPLEEISPSLVGAAFDSPEGKLVTAQAMVEPIKRALDYQGIGRKMVMMQQIG